MGKTKDLRKRVSRADRAASKKAKAQQALAVLEPSSVISNVIQVLWDEIAEYSQRYLAALDAIRQIQDPDSDEFAEQWAEIDVSLFVMQLKIKDVLKEMERLEESWPD
ncbi:MAG: hypothetical protein NZO41_03685 [Candidatus Bipolaricaulota bacterium]|nr:hypothetical protein [Candidatus Bipolaricaulota bacterium]